MTRKYYIALCPYKILQNYFQWCLCTRISGSLCANGNGFCFADVLLGRNRVSWAVLGVMLASLENSGGLVSQVCNENYILKAFSIVFHVIPKYTWGLYMSCRKLFYIRNKLPLLLRLVRVPGFPFQFWGWSRVKTCLCWWGLLVYPCGSCPSCGIISMLAERSWWNQLSLCNSESAGAVGPVFSTTLLVQKPVQWPYRLLR